ncbi:zonular occludens toxin domain-containing protein [Novosphingobium naphthalenivorans]|uniref:zonular occludens toxin domain-containing protein n=1 Tax=Novosphingobium naphthalenivorans TaxID=273168 RepID=UPI00082E0F61|nr:zonular occludens toxin domain-containing protein [Novosphingobium naphthalenivorans]
MAITAYTGPPGSGKTYALVHDVLLPALADGRRVFSNIDGLNSDLILDYLEAKHPDRAGKFGALERFDGVDAIEPGFWPDVDRKDMSAKVQGGDLVIFDEVGIHWPISGQFPRDIGKFLRFHRHYVDANGQSTDVVLATQGVMDLHRHYRALIERTYKFKKLSTLGLNRSYAWSVWEGSTQRKGEAVVNGQGRYDKAIFPLYKSYKGPGGSETSTDKRANVLRQPKVVVTIAGAVASMLAAVWFLWSMFSGGSLGDDVQPQAVASEVSASPSPRQAVAGSSSMPSPEPFSSAWRIAGMMRVPGVQVVVLSDQKGAVRYEDLSNCSMVNGRPYVCSIDGQRVVSMGGLGQVSGKGAGSWSGL